VGGKSIMGVVRPKGFRRIQCDFEIDGVRFRPTLPQKRAWMEGLYYSIIAIESGSQRAQEPIVIGTTSNLLQLDDARVRDVGVAGSNPVTPTIINNLHWPAAATHRFCGRSVAMQVIRLRPRLKHGASQDSLPGVNDGQD
jgi:hypothetical protein